MRRPSRKSIGRRADRRTDFRSTGRPSEMPRRSSCAVTNVVDALPRFGHRGNEFLHFLVHRVHLVCVERGAVREIGYEHDIRRRFEARRRNPDVDLQDARHEVAAAFELFLHLQRVLRTRAAFGRFLQLPHDDMSDHFVRSCSCWFGDSPVTLASRAPYTRPLFACVRLKSHPADKNAGHFNHPDDPLFHRATYRQQDRQVKADDKPTKLADGNGLYLTVKPPGSTLS
ncbi:hypothetical protein BLAT2472_11103 [Burkholderia latens]